MNQVHPEVFAKHGILAPCRCGGFYEVLQGFKTKEIPKGENIEIQAEPIYTAGCLKCKTTFKSEPHVHLAVDNFMMEVKHDKS